jgi:RHS repeat-associated protein
MTNITSPAGGFAYVYDSQAHQAVGKLFLPNGAYITNAYDTMARTVATTLKNSVNGVLDEWDYLYDQGNQRVEIARTDGSFVDYAYDKIGQLKAANGWEVDGMTPRAHEQFGYDYDAAGNLHLRTNNALVQTFNVNGLNELTNASRAGTYTVAGATRGEATSVTVNSSAATLYGDHTFTSTNHTLANGNNTFTAVATDGYGRTSTDAVTAYLPATNGFVYDANGNLTSDGQRNFAYDDENQLISVWVTNAWRSDFVYDGKLRRRARFESKWIGGAWVTNTLVRYVYDGNLVVQERDGNNLPSVTYTRGKDLSGSLEGAGGIGGLLARTDNSAMLGVSSGTYPHAYYHADANGNVTCLVDSGQAVVAKYLYDPFGSILSQSGALADANLYRFSSKELHAKSGLVHYLYRYYEPALQRWPNRDPLGEPGFELVRGTLSARLRGIAFLYLSGLNQYAFIHNRAGNDIDPLGLLDAMTCSYVIRRAARLIEQAAEAKANHEYITAAALEGEAERLLNIYQKFCMPPDPPPEPPRVPVPAPSCPDTCKKVAVVAGGVAAGYIVYRCVRMIPSLFPPLWPTIPVNVVAP